MNYAELLAVRLAESGCRRVFKFSSDGTPDLLYRSPVGVIYEIVQKMLEQNEPWFARKVSKVLGLPVLGLTLEDMTMNNFAQISRFVENFFPQFLGQHAATHGLQYDVKSITFEAALARVYGPFDQVRKEKREKVGGVGRTSYLLYKDDQKLDSFMLEHSSVTTQVIVTYRFPRG